MHHALVVYKNVTLWFYPYSICYKYNKRLLTHKINRTQILITNLGIILKTFETFKLCVIIKPIITYESTLKTTPIQLTCYTVIGV